MTRSHAAIRFLVLAAVALAVTAALAAAPAAGKKYDDVPKSHWARSYIDWVTDRAVEGHYLLDDYGDAFKPELPITRELLARSLVLASGHYGEQYKPLKIKDVPEGYRYYTVVQMAVRLGYLGLADDRSFHPTQEVTAAQAETAVVRWLKGRYPDADWTLLRTLQRNVWEPNDGWKPKPPAFMPWIVASRQLQLRPNHPTEDDRHETLPTEPIDRAEVAYMMYRGYKVGDEWMISGLHDYRQIAFPPLSPRQKQIARFALQFIGYPYVWAGEYPTPNSPYGHQASGGFDCSGFVFYVMKMHFEYPIRVEERGGADMVDHKPRIKRKDLTCGDIIAFAPNGPKSSVHSIYHVGLYLGDGWFIHSTGSTGGVMLNSLDEDYYKKYFAWGRRLLKPAELEVDPPPDASAPAGTP